MIRRYSAVVLMLIIFISGVSFSADSQKIEYIRQLLFFPSNADASDDSSMARSLPSAIANGDDERNIKVSQTSVSTEKEKRIALVIGNSSYKNSPLANPVNDARAMAELLNSVGFEVTKLENATLEDTRNASREFGDKIKGNVSLFYFAGHGIQVKGKNYLVPVDADIHDENEVAGRSFIVSEILDKMESAKSTTNIVILDACRNNPFARSYRSLESGLASMDAPSGTVIAYATSPNMTAADGEGKNGLYTSHLLRNIAIPGLQIEDIFKAVRAGVEKDSGGQQRPWESTSLKGKFYFLDTEQYHREKVEKAKAEVSQWEREIGALNAKMDEARKAQDSAREREIERDRLLQEAELKQAKLRE